MHYFIIGNGGHVSISVAFDKNTDTTNPIYPAIKSIAGINVVKESDKELKEDLEKGRITAIITIGRSGLNNPPYKIDLVSSEAVNPQNINVLQSILNAVIAGINQRNFADAPTIAIINNTVKKIPGRIYRTIDFILPGQLGFSLLSSGVFGVAFLFFNLRQQLVLKRFFATPIKRPYIVFGEALSRVVFQMFTAIIIVGAGHFFFKFTLVNGFATFFSIMLLSFIGLILFMGLGFIVGSVSRTESTIPLFSNLLTMPQFLLAGTFFPVEVFPSWLQPLCKALPLTHFNTAIRNVAFEGASLASCWKDISILGVWIVVIYSVAFKTFKWE